MPAGLAADAVHPNGHRRSDQAGRPRERLLQYGAHTLTDAELVSLLLWRCATGAPGSGPFAR
jgi:DNA repair protein RadC